eukprot:TRINITY_DN40404_c0_g1_i1.p1 TRINITY_DN40404_c0_g1~~TRINITY_DN40404_c0_g1_i1.p1  ORF type:complete len:241 (-),score=37.98 TRINITY_DN40404_c0_g1_i1:30-752(-)
MGLCESSDPEPATTPSNTLRAHREARTTPAITSGGDPLASVTPATVSHPAELRDNTRYLLQSRALQGARVGIVSGAAVVGTDHGVGFEWELCQSKERVWRLVCEGKALGVKSDTRLMVGEASAQGGRGYGYDWKLMRGPDGYYELRNLAAPVGKLQLNKHGVLSYGRVVAVEEDTGFHLIDLDPFSTGVSDTADAARFCGQLADERAQQLDRNLEAAEVFGRATRRFARSSGKLNRAKSV